MARVLLVSYAGYPYTPSSLIPDNGLASLAGALIESGHEVSILDFSTVNTVRRLFPPHVRRIVRPLAEKMFIEGAGLSAVEKARFLYAANMLEHHQTREMRRIAAEVALEARSFGADVLGLKLWNGDGYAGSVEIAKVVRAAVRGIRIIAGGPQVEYFGKTILMHTDAFEVLVRGDGETLLPELVTRLVADGKWRALPGLFWREHGRNHETPPSMSACLDDLPRPCYDPEVYPALDGDEKIRIGVLDESRGCPNRCAFCIHPIKSGGRWRVKSATRVVDEARAIMAGLNTRYIFYSGSNTSGKTAVAIAEEILQRGVDMDYVCFGHVRGIGQADFSLLRRSGCRAIFYGLESGSSEVLRKAFRKPINLEQARRALLQTKQAGICTITSIIHPAPFEFEYSPSRRETLDFLDSVRPDSVPVTIPGLIPGTPWEREAETFGFRKAERIGFRKPNRQQFWEYALTYKIKLLYPPSMWKPLPYTLNGRSSKELFRETQNFVNEVEGMGLLTNVAHELVLMAEALGQGDDLRGFRDRCRADFLSGAAEAIGSMVAEMNEAMRPQPVSEELVAGNVGRPGE